MFAQKFSRAGRVTGCWCFVASLLVAGAGAAEPTVEVDYEHPSGHLSIPASLGNVTAIQKQANALKGRSAKSTIRNVLTWIHKELKYDGEKAYAWRNYDTVVEEQCYGGCADEAIVCGVLLRAAGIPAVWVKTMDVNWIWTFKKGFPFETWSGHVFLEVWLDGEWVLLDASQGMIYRDYTPKARILPGNRFAYHKGDDPKAMVMSLQWEDWKEQTREYFAALDESLLPVNAAGGTSVTPRAFIAGNAPYYQVMSEMVRQKGWIAAHSFNGGYEKFLPPARGNILLIETHDGKPIVPLDVLDAVYPGASKGLESSSQMTTVDETTIYFLDLAKQLDAVSLDD